MQLLMKQHQLTQLKELKSIIMAEIVDMADMAEIVDMADMAVDSTDTVVKTRTDTEYGVKSRNMKQQNSINKPINEQI
jgi:hypothetical protein